MKASQHPLRRTLRLVAVLILAIAPVTAVPGSRTKGPAAVKTEAPASDTAPAATPAAEHAVVLERDFGKLYGTLLTPAGAEARTAVLIIAGSGPTDRDGNSPLGVSADSYHLLAEALADAGIASLRYDKRAIAQSIVDPQTIADLTLDDYIADAAALADYLHAQGYERVVLAGHSEGALIALCAAQQSPAVSAVVTLCGAGYPMDEILRLQLARQLAPAHMELLLEAEGILAALKRGEKVDMSAHSQMLYGLFNPGVQQFLISSLRRDPQREIRDVKVPVLVVGGDNDLQVSADNAAALAKARPGAEKVIVEGMTHPLKHSGEKTLEGQLRTVYKDPALPLDTTLTAAVIGFIRGL